MPNRSACLLLAAACAGGFGCTSTAKSVAPASKPRTVSVRAFTEAAPVVALAATPTYLFTASGDGLDRWDLTGDARLHLSKEHGLPGSHVTALAYDSSRDWLWVATDVGVSRYEVASATFSELPPPPEVLGIRSFEGATLAPANDGGVWVGLEGGLFYIQPGSSWTKTGVDAKVNALHQDRQGILWIASEAGLLRVGTDGVARELGENASCQFAAVAAMAPFDDDTVVLQATAADGAPVLAFAKEGGCVAFDAPDEARTWRGVASTEQGTYVLAQGQLYRLDVGDANRALARGAARLVRRSGDSVKLVGEPTLAPLPAKVPSDVRTVASNGASLFLGAGRIGTMEWKEALGDKAGRWFRRGQLAADADVLSVACASEESCFIATAATTENNRLWHWDGKAFYESLDPARVLGVARLRDGTILSFAEAASFDEAENGALIEDGQDAPANAVGAAVEVRRLEGTEWQPISGIAIETPGDAVRIKAIRQAPDGQLWVSLGYWDSSEEATPYGVAVLDLALGYVVYHRASFDETSTKRGILPIPVDVTGIGFIGQDEVWLASSQGATRVIGEKLHTYREYDGLRSELLDGLVCSSGGMVYVASSDGVGAWDGERWDFPPAMRTAINDVAIADGGQLWLATEKGLGVYNGSKVGLLDTARGLLENRIVDIESDRFGRIWALSAQGLVLVAP